VILKLKFWIQGPKSWDSTFQVQSLTPKHQIKRHSESRERRFTTWLGICHGKRQNKCSAHLQSSSGYSHEL
jgi:hypothetical protein